MPKISIIIRTKNEEKWISHCLKMVYSQTIKDFEVIIVDNKSSDNTLVVAKRFPVNNIITVDPFRPGHAINEGIRVSSGQFIVCLSAHCVPKDFNWLENLMSGFEVGDNVAAVYGRQLPVSFTSPIDKRDLMIVFGQDQRIQIKDYFFHNANSMFRKDVWNSIPFDESVTNIEDRVWGKEVISKGYQIVYEPTASVFHHHGLHQGNSLLRAKGVVSIIERVDKEFVNDLPTSLKPENVQIDAVIPINVRIEKDSINYKLLMKLISELSSSKYVNNIYVVSSQYELAVSNSKWIDRKELADADICGLDELLRQILNIIETNNEFPESILYVNYDYINRPESILDSIIEDAQINGYDSVFPALVEYGHYWYKNANDEFEQTDKSLESRELRQATYKALYGIGCLISTALIRKGLMIGGKVGILPVNNIMYSLRCKDFEDLSICETLFLKKAVYL